MKLTLDALQAMDAIERLGSFAAAAAELHRVPSALTYTVQKLEQDLDVVLFDRSGHRARLTPAGQELMQEGRHLLRAAGELECRVKRIATGWETELRIALDIMIPAVQLFPLIAAFYAEQSGTRIRLAHEVLAGTWDALVSGRAELALGVSGEVPAGGGYAIRILGYKDFVFAVAPTHPLAGLPEPLKHEQILAHRAIAIGDSSRSLPPRSVGLLTGQDVLTVPDLESKVAAQVAGLGCGYLPAHAAAPLIKAKRLVAKEVEEIKPAGNLYYAWRSREKGKALRWFLKRLEHQETRASLLRY
ncbi:MAG: LysR family transcriptional regulator [Betaproteobacteria bacterium RIFCSPLOWO2_12_FULL_64_23]|nr:MAG: LysR family transcriptional regulator [Betaproteobacteria bacterium RIFCSPLOWO2_12_FULL_64_23]